MVLIYVKAVFKDGW